MRISRTVFVFGIYFTNTNTVLHHSQNDTRFHVSEYYLVSVIVIFQLFSFSFSIPSKILKQH